MSGPGYSVSGPFFLINFYDRIVLWGRHKKMAADMARVFQQFGHLLKKMLEQLAVRTEDGRLIYQDMLCMSWVDVCDADAFSSQVAPTHVSPQPSTAADNQR
jgi:hypothetical protein